MRFTTFVLAMAAMAAPAFAQFPATEVSGLGAPPFYLTKAGGTFENLGGGIVYDIYRRIAGEEFRCLAPDLPAPTWTGDPGSPPAGEAWWYTVNGYDGTDENLHGSSRPIEVPCHVPPATLTVEKLASSTTVAPGADFTYTITITNTGTVDATNVQVLDDLTTNGCMTLTSCDSSTPPLGGLLTCTPPATITTAGFTIPASQSQTITLTATAGTTPGTCINTVNVRGDNFAPLSADGPIDIVNTGCTPVPGTPPLRLVVEATGLSSPVHLTHAPGDSSRLFVVQRGGRIRIVRSGTLVTTPFLDITTLVLSGGERGLLSMAFHPDYATNGRFYVYYTRQTDGGIAVAEYQVSTDPDVADPATARVLFNCPHPGRSNHNGGQIAFSPRDGYLYIGIGDGGGGGDPDENAEDLTECLGKLLRIDVNGATTTPPLPYIIPPNNPFVSAPPARPEIWAYGLRNPWRFSFDRVTADLYIGEVGQNQWEEVDVQPAASLGGEHYGWDQYEGNMHCFEPPCNPTGKTWPVTEYDHGMGFSITGGHVYRGCHLPGYHGTYFYADYISDRVWSFEYDAALGTATNPTEWTSSFGPSGFTGISSFGEDANGEVYLVGLGGTIYRISD